MQTFTVLAVALLAAHLGMAQAHDPGPSIEVQQSCLLGTPMETWTALKLSTDQRRRMQLVQEACKAECVVGGVQADPNPISHTDGTSIMGEVTNILSKEQYQAWLAYCASTGSEPSPR